MIQEFQHFVELKLIQVMMIKMLLIQFESRVMVTQTIVTEFFSILSNLLCIVFSLIWESTLEESPILPDVEATFSPPNLP
jgi:hypothetical protein